MMHNGKILHVSLRFTKLSLMITHINVSDTVNILFVTVDIHWTGKVKKNSTLLELSLTIRGLKAPDSLCGYCLLVFLK